MRIQLAKGAARESDGAEGTFLVDLHCLTDEAGLHRIIELLEAKETLKDTTLFETVPASELAEAVALLREAEWNGEVGQYVPDNGCWFCKGSDEAGHQPGCKLAAFLARHTAGTIEVVPAPGDLCGGSKVIRAYGSPPSEWKKCPGCRACS